MEQQPQDPLPVKHSSAKAAWLVVLAIAVSAVATLIYHNLQNKKRGSSPSEEGFDLKEQAAGLPVPSTATLAVPVTPGTISKPASTRH